MDVYVWLVAKRSHKFTGSLHDSLLLFQNSKGHVTSLEEKNPKQCNDFLEPPKVTGDQTCKLSGCTKHLLRQISRDRKGGKEACCKKNQIAGRSYILFFRTCPGF